MGQQQHVLLPWQIHDELAGENFVHALKSHVATRVSPGVCARSTNIAFVTGE